MVGLALGFGASMAASAKEPSSVASGVPEEDKEEEVILVDRDRGFQASEPALHQSELIQTQVRREIS